jgi:hypothetical protein
MALSGVPLIWARPLDHFQSSTLFVILALTGFLSIYLTTDQRYSSLSTGHEKYLFSQSLPVRLYLRLKYCAYWKVTPCRHFPSPSTSIGSRSRWKCYVKLRIMWSWLSFLLFPSLFSPFFLSVLPKLLHIILCYDNLQLARAIRWRKGVVMALEQVFSSVHARSGSCDVTLWGGFRRHSLTCCWGTAQLIDYP